MLDVKTVRRYIAAAEACGLAPGPEPPLDDEQVTAVVAALAAETGRPHGDAWLRCEAERDAIEKLVTAGVRLSKVRRLLHRRGIDVPYPTLHRLAVAGTWISHFQNGYILADGVSIRVFRF